jgi:hypothetical protein
MNACDLLDSIMDNNTLVNFRPSCENDIKDYALDNYDKKISTKVSKYIFSTYKEFLKSRNDKGLRFMRNQLVLSKINI